ncbi:RcpC/CpaB family pilus assembly protein, partial [Aminipila sp.]|uniref:RcpC/CpaB family pilus assembly protein n=1 Tax=Aminipila sp. TaxID=2060095 RepID=UPI00289B6CF0
IVSIIAPDYKKQGTTVIPPELQYVEVIAVTAGSGYDANTGEQEDAEEKELPSTVTLLVTPEQSKILAMLEADGNLHISLVYRGSKENVNKFVKAQESVLSKLYPPLEEKQKSSESEESTEQTVPSVSANTPIESEAE